jgi:hypothetical protein
MMPVIILDTATVNVAIYRGSCELSNSDPVCFASDDGQSITVSVNLGISVFVVRKSASSMTIQIRGLIWSSLGLAQDYWRCKRSSVCKSRPSLTDPYASSEQVYHSKRMTIPYACVCLSIRQCIKIVTNYIGYLRRRSVDMISIDSLFVCI